MSDTIASLTHVCSASARMEALEIYFQFWRVPTLPFGRRFEGRGPRRHGHQPTSGVKLCIAFGPRHTFHWKVKACARQRDFTLCVANKALGWKGKAGVIGTGLREALK